MNAKLFDILAVLLTSVSLALAGFSLKWTFDANAEMKVLRSDMERMRTDKERDDRQDRSIRQFWSYTKWLHWQTQELRHKAGLPPIEGPNLNGQ